MPDLGIAAIKAKIDTGARTSALHAVGTRLHSRGARTLVSFHVYPDQRCAARAVEAEAELVEQRRVRSSTGHVELRPVVLVDLAMLESTWTIEVTLTRREQMGFRLLLGRQALRRRFCVDPARSFVADRPRRRRTHKHSVTRFET